MIIEVLSRKTFDDNFQDFSKCEDKWKVNNLVDLAFLKESMRGLIEVAKEFSPDRDLSFYEWDYVLNELNNGRIVADMFNFYRVKDEKRMRCPLCGNGINEPFFALSRRDNQTKICPKCGEREAFEDILGER